MMLHVKRLKGRLAISFRQHERRFSRELWIGLMVAVLLHACCFTLFRIATKGSDVTLPLSPLQVEVDIRGAHLAHLSRTPLEPADLPQLTPPMISLPSQETLFEMEWQEPNFSSLEAIDYESLYIDFDDEDD